MVFYILALALGPSLFLLFYTYTLDKWEPEPKGLVAKLFFLGMLAILPAALVEWSILSLMALSTTSMDVVTSLLVAFVIVGAVEEFCKYIPFKLMVASDEEFDEPIDGVVYMVASALGFATVDVICYTVMVGGYRDIMVATTEGGMRAVLAIPFHAISSAYLGIALGKAEFRSSNFAAFFLILVGYFVAVVVHGLCEFFLFRHMAWATVAVILISGFLLLQQIPKLYYVSPYRPIEPEVEP